MGPGRRGNHAWYYRPAAGTSVFTTNTPVIEFRITTPQYKCEPSATRPSRACGLTTPASTPHRPGPADERPEVEGIPGHTRWPARLRAPWPSTTRTRPATPRRATATGSSGRTCPDPHHPRRLDPKGSGRLSFPARPASAGRAVGRPEPESRDGHDPTRHDLPEIARFMLRPGSGLEKVGVTWAEPRSTAGTVAVTDGRSGEGSGRRRRIRPIRATRSRSVVGPQGIEP